MKQKFDKFSINNRILLIMQEKNLNKNSVSKVIGITQPALKKIENNENLPSLKLLFGLLRVFPDINANWLITGEGNMINPTQKVSQNNTGNGQQLVLGNGNTGNITLSLCQQEVEVLRARLKDKEEIIDLLRAQLKKERKK